ncbi:conserved membrane hypothetical protein [Tenacibaculum litopenaei]
MLKTWFKLFFRNQKKNWLNTAVNISGLTISLGVLLLVLLYLKDEKSYNSTNPYKDKVYRVVHQMSDMQIWTTSTAIEGKTYLEEVPEVADFYLSRGWYDADLVTYRNKKHYTRNILMGNARFFDFFPFEIVQGSKSKFKEAKNHIALSKKLATTYFGKTNPIGQSIEIENISYIVTTVYEITGKHYFEPDMVRQFQEEPEGHWGSFSYNLLLKCNDVIDIPALEQKFNAVWVKKQAEPQAKKDGLSVAEWERKYGTKVLLEPLNTIRLDSYTEEGGPEGKGNYKLIVIMLSLAVLLLIISCVNFINLSLASATQRAKEVGVKKTLGLTKFNLMSQYMLEVLVKASIAFVFALLIVELILPSFNQFIGKELVLWNELTAVFQVFLVTVFIALIIGYFPALHMAKFESIEVLKGSISRSRKGIFAQNIMLGVQFLISGFFLTASIIIYQQVAYMMAKDLGFAGEQVVMITMNAREDRYDKYQLAKKELIKHSHIEEVSSSFFVPNGGSSNSTNTSYGDNLAQSNSNAIDFNYLDMVAIEMHKGRQLDPNLASDTISNVLINETMAKQLGIYQDPLGKKIKIGFSSDDEIDKYTVVGVVKDYHVFGLDRKIPPTFFCHWNTFDWIKEYNFYNIQLKVNPENIQETMQFVEKFWRQNIEQDYPFSYRFLDKNFQRTFRKYTRQKTLFSILTYIVIVISLLGLFALATLTIQQRLKEVAIRKTLGASVQELMLQLMKGFLKITLIASVVLIPIAYFFMQEWLDNFVYRIDMPVIPFVITPIILAVLVFIVVGLKAFKATKVNLIKYLKFE